MRGFVERYSDLVVGGVAAVLAVALSIVACILFG